MINEALRAVVDLRDRTLQKARIQFSNRISAGERGADELGPEAKVVMDRWFSEFDRLEKQANADIKKMSSGVAIIEEITKVKGVGPILAAKVVAMIDIKRSDHVSDLWRYAGFAVIDGKRERPVKGEKLHYNMRLKTTCFLIASSFLKSRSPYQAVYASSKEYYQTNRPDWTKLHIHYASMRRMTKLWLAHLWLVWRELEGLPVTDPYVQEKLGHTHISKPEDFGWRLAKVSKKTRVPKRARAMKKPVISKRARRKKKT